MKRLHCTLALVLGSALGCGSSPSFPSSTDPDASIEDGDVGSDVGLGAPCTQAGLLGCAGHAQKLQLLCDGTKWVSNGVCPDQKLCDTRPGPTLGSCQDPDPRCIGRSPGETYCDGATRITCGPDLLDGKASTCASAEHCKQGTGDKCAMCLDGAFRCKGPVLETCAPDRLDYVTKATCATEALCVDAYGKCLPPVCALDEYRCDLDTLQKCRPTRNDWDTVKICPKGMCDAAAMGCRECVPGSKDCAAGETPRLCDSTGHWSSSTPCAGTTPLCKAGVCAAGACVTGEHRCSSDTLEICNSTLSGFDPVKVCAAGMCDATGGECDECASGAKDCIGSTPRACDTSGHWTSLSACAGTTPICKGGACIAGVCVSGEHRCTGDVLEKCSSTFTSFEIVKTCPSGFCDATLGQCDECKVGDTDCVGSTPRSCDATTLRWKAGTPCSGTTPACKAGACVAFPKGWGDMASPASIGFAGRRFHTAVWTGSEMIVYGGYGAITWLYDAASYNPMSDTWTSASSPAILGRYDHCAVWSGTEMIVWAGTTGASAKLRNDGAFYDPVAKKWTTMSTVGAPSPRDRPSAVWSTTTNEMIVWGGYDGTYFVATGGRFQPSTNTWTTMAAPPTAFKGRASAGAVWTGTKLLIFGGYSPGGCTGWYCGDAATYDPVTNTWAMLSGLPTSLDGRYQHVARATGSTLASATFWGGYGTLVGGSNYRNTGATFDGTTWTTISAPSESVLAGSARSSSASWWGFGKLYVWGGLDTTGALGNGAIYDPGSDSWTTMPSTNAPPARWGATTVWTGDAAIVWGGSASSTSLWLQDGKVFRP